MRTTILLLVAMIYHCTMMAQETWIVPETDDKVKSPFDLTDDKNVEKGEKIFGKVCWTCHGESGQGDGVAAEALEPKPADLTSTIVQDQSEGAFYWKITKGRGNMVGYEEALSDKQRWQLVAFIKSLAKGAEE